MINNNNISIQQSANLVGYQSSKASVASMGNRSVYSPVGQLDAVASAIQSLERLGLKALEASSPTTMS
ncbi:hypothetical protein DFQ30_010331 [Apophysomyces sp. BC1015]|nr:hypothetical protein DFQ30_010331 [Apophysomyces sp. BC1015]KAG0181277.1 hypothetical protein DFQ29_008804 [Apophysomyces sp. BC1021]